ncbi:hypothetical protein I79_009064 [Cricetulus griseus]|uniref:Uncharacterized protein n=1 Tax=Cricetulus griseus TaxID=10029 RepID=G3HES0_CRIGR|nr:hypothetical protein I79_009064 [Cricetulus griseus]
MGLRAPRYPHEAKTLSGQASVVGVEPSVDPCRVPPEGSPGGRHLIVGQGNHTRK